MANHKYQSVQLKMPPGIVSEVSAFQDKNIAQEWLGKGGEEDRPHVTVLYGLEDKSREDIKQIFEGFGPVTVWFGGVKAFLASDTGKAEDVLYVEVLGREVDVLHLLCAAYMPYVSTNPEYRPHMTLAYLKPGLAAKVEGRDWFRGKNVTVNGIEFADTDETIGRVRLKEEMEIEGRVFSRVPEGVREGMSGSMAAHFGYKVRDGKGWVPIGKLEALIKLSKELKKEFPSGT
jgi:2'-5' RNA ligase